MNKFFGLWLCLLVALCAFQQATPFGKLTVDNITLFAPADFRLMSDPEIAARYFHYKKPTAAYLDQSQRAELVVNKTGNEWEDKDLNILRKFYKANLNFYYTNVTFLQDEIQTINQRQYVVFEFVSEVKPDDKDFAGKQLGNKTAYSYMMYTVKDSEIIVFNFTCPAQERYKWQPIANKMMKSVQMM